MNSIEFEKVSLEQFTSDLKRCGIDMDDTKIKKAYDGIQLPKRASVGSAGYDFYAPIDVVVTFEGTKAIPTGIKAKMPLNVCLMLYARSSLGFKGVTLINGTGIIDSDYYYSDSGGDICFKLICTKDTNKYYISQGDKVMQGIFTTFLKTDDDNCDGIRLGGFGSSDVRASPSTSSYSFDNK